MRNLIELTEQRDLLSQLLSGREHRGVPQITIGGEHRHPRLAPFTLVTSEYRFGNVSGVLGVIGPTRMPYEKVVSLVSHTSRLVSDLLH